MVESVQKPTTRIYNKQNQFMKENKLAIVEKLITEKKIDEAQFEPSKLGSEYFKNSEYVLLWRSSRLCRLVESHIIVSYKAIDIFRFLVEPM